MINVRIKDDRIVKIINPEFPDEPTPEGATLTEFDATMNDDVQLIDGVLSIVVPEVPVE
jgi:hypothetical protein